MEDSLVATGISVHFGSLKAVDDVTLSLRRGEIVGLIGPNGAGKTTLVNALSGFQRLTAGGIQLGTREVSGWSPHRRARSGVIRSFQAVRLFHGFTVAENIEAAALGAGASPRKARAKARELLEHFEMAALAGHPADGLPHGEERRVGILRALAAAPAFLLLDEPAAGLNEDESDELGFMLTAIRDDLGCGLCVIEHDMRLVMSRCERLHVLAFGCTLAEGSPSEIQQDAAVVEAYLGTDHDAAA